MIDGRLEVLAEPAHLTIERTDLVLTDEADAVSGQGSVKEHQKWSAWPRTAVTALLFRG